jgi:hypothetical protein
MIGNRIAAIAWRERIFCQQFLVTVFFHTAIIPPLFKTRAVRSHSQKIGKAELLELFLRYLNFAARTKRVGDVDAQPGTSQRISKDADGFELGRSYFPGMRVEFGTVCKDNRKAMSDEQHSETSS